MKAFRELYKTKKWFRRSLQTLSALPLAGLFFIALTDVALANPIADAFVWAIDKSVGNVFEWVSKLIAWIASVFAFLGGQFLDMSVRYTVNGSNLRIDGVIQGWTIFRDLVNMFFIFILLYVAIMTILQAANYNTRKVLANLIVIGILINFSFFLTGFVIDIGNALASALYSAVTPNGTNVGGILTGQMNLSLLKEGVGGAESNFQNGVGYLLNALFFTIAAFVFFAGGMLMIARHISLLFVLMLSPLALAAFILPNTHNHWKTWLNKLLEGTFVAPAYMLMIVVTVTIASAPDLLANANLPTLSIGTSGQIASPLIDGGGLLLNYIVIIGLMIGSLTVARSVSSGLAGSATKWAGKTIGIGAGAGGWAGRKTLGRLSKGIADSEYLKNKAAHGGNFATRWAARQTLKGANVGASASFDARGGKLGKVVGTTAGNVLGSQNINVNTGKAEGKGGYRKVREDQIKKEKDFATHLSKTKGATAKEQEVIDRRKRRVDTIKGDIDVLKKSIHSGNLSARDRADAEAELKRQEKDLKYRKDELKKAKDAPSNRGDVRKEAHAEYLATRGTTGYFKSFVFSRESKHMGQEAAREIRKGKSNAQKMLDAYKAEEESSKDSDDSSSSTPPAAAPPPTTP